MQSCRKFIFGWTSSEWGENFHDNSDSAAAAFSLEEQPGCCSLQELQGWPLEPGPAPCKLEIIFDGLYMLWAGLQKQQP